MSADDDVIVLALATDASLMHSQIFFCNRVKLLLNSSGNALSE